MFANVDITFERMNIFTCGKKQMVAWIKAVTGGGLGPGQGPNKYNIIYIVYCIIYIVYYLIVILFRHNAHATLHYTGGFK